MRRPPKTLDDPALLIGGRSHNFAAADVEADNVNRYS